MTTLSIKTSGGTGDADLYVRKGSQPTTSAYDYRPYLSGNTESVSVSNPAAAVWHIGIRAYSTFSGVTLTVSYAP
ncbi:MAG: PPC domain-containing protein [Acidobacteria bacterium]|nr:PPC domain-containing protein [Acidobacteriota bacterium]